MSNPDDAPLAGRGALAIARVQAALGSLVASERRVAEVVLAEPRAVIGMTASQLADRASTSATTVIRFARNAGFSGYQELAIALAVSEPELDATPELSPADSPAQTLKTVSALAAAAVGAVPAAVDARAFTDAVSTLAGSRHTLAIGAALTAPVAEDLSFRLNHLGLSSDAPADSQIQWIRAQHLTKDDVCVAFLHGGTYPHVVGVARDAKAAGATVIAITSFVRTPLAELADIALVVGANTARAGLGAWASRLAYLTIVDALVLAISNTDPDRYRLSLERIYELIEQDLL